MREDDHRCFCACVEQLMTGSCPCTRRLSRSDETATPCGPLCGDTVCAPECSGTKDEEVRALRQQMLRQRTEGFIRSTASRSFPPAVGLRRPRPSVKTSRYPNYTVEAQAALLLKLLRRPDDETYLDGDGYLCMDIELGLSDDEAALVRLLRR